LTPSTKIALQSRIRLTLAAACLAFAIIQLDVTIINVALPQIGKQLSTGIPEMQWIVDAYTLVLAVFLLTTGVLSDRLGSRRIFIAGFVLFGVASTICGLAQTIDVLIVARILQGFGGALVLPTSLALIAHAYKDDDHARVRAVSIWATSGSLATAAGPIIGGFLISAGGWRWIFFVNIPICALGLVLAVKYVKETTKNSRGNYDFIGQVLVTIALISLISSLIEIGKRGWLDPLVCGGFVLSVITGVAFLMRQARIANPMVPLAMFHSAPFSSAVFSATALSVTFYGLIFVLSLYFQTVLKYSPPTTGLAFLPLTGSIVIATLASFKLIDWIGYRFAISGGLLVAVTGYGCLAILSTDAPLVSMVPGMILITLGMGTVIPATASVVLGSVVPELSGTAAAILNTSRQFGGALGVALFGSIVSGNSAWIAEHVRLVYMISAALLLLAMLGSFFSIRNSTN
jgi:DHA2 family methylenomycin A resistance protein-like MFS transporter